MLRLLEEGTHDLPVAQPQEQVLPSDFVVRRIMTVMSQTTNDDVDRICQMKAALSINILHSFDRAACVAPAPAATLRLRRSHSHSHAGRAPKNLSRVSYED